MVSPRVMENVSPSPPPPPRALSQFGKKRMKNCLLPPCAMQRAEVPSQGRSCLLPAPTAGPATTRAGSSTPPLVKSTQPWTQPCLPRTARFGEQRPAPHPHPHPRLSPSPAAPLHPSLLLTHPPKHARVHADSFYSLSVSPILFLFLPAVPTLAHASEPSFQMAQPAGALPCCGPFPSQSPTFLVCDPAPIFSPLTPGPPSLSFRVPVPPTHTPPSVPALPSSQGLGDHDLLHEVCPAPHCAPSPSTLPALRGPPR